MTKDEAFALSRETGCKITHMYFSPNEWCIIKGNWMEFEDGCGMFFSDFMHWRDNSPNFLTGWEVVKE